MAIACEEKGVIFQTVHVAMLKKMMMTMQVVVVAAAAAVAVVKTMKTILKTHQP